ncbi:AAA family ATPase, partial [Elizabethkingia sp. HvH-WGS333]|uniref:AAA family ATPase n=3 Tax=Elizabethkingia TaxID=308865 RepID=UPI000A86796A
IIYHLKNIDSVIPSEREELQGEFMRFKLPPVYNFENVNIILDEIELYFHPEFQRAFIKELLDRINSINFEKLKSINILFITHSPFILSDIPKSNILFLENGLPVFPMTENTFASNIHTLLQHGFFLNSVPIGDFAKNKINSLFKILHEGDIKDNNGNDIYEQILIVSEPFIKNQLLKLYNGLNPKSKNFELESVVKELKRELNELKKRIND